MKKFYSNSEIKSFHSNECIANIDNEKKEIYLGKLDDEHYKTLSINYIKFNCIKR